MLEDGHRRRAAKRITGGDGRPLQPFRWWQLLSGRTPLSRRIGVVPVVMLIIRMSLNPLRLLHPPLRAPRLRGLPPRARRAQLDG